jgi:hypothetical protein
MFVREVNPVVNPPRRRTLPGVFQAEVSDEQ